MTGKDLAPTTVVSYYRVLVAVGQDRSAAHLAVGAGGVRPRRRHQAVVRASRCPTLSPEVLAAHLARFGEGPDRLMLTSNTGASLRRSMWGKAYRSAVMSVGIDSSTHDLRHHCASVLISLGASITAVQQYLGHKNALETLDTYGHLMLETRIVCGRLSIPRCDRMCDRCV